jgi:plasmid stabilization system protein ParE
MGGLEGGVEAEVRVKLPVIIGATAAAELRDHLARMAKESSAASRHLNEEVGTTFDLISEFPHLYERFDGDLRRAVLKRWSLGIFYERLADAVFVAAILDLRRDPAAIRRRLGLHEGATEFLTDPGLAPSSVPTLA